MLLVEKDRWVYLDKGYLWLDQQNTPRPRRKIYLEQLRSDFCTIKSYMVYVLVLAGFYCLYSSWISSSWSSLLLGVVLLCMYFYMFFRTTRDLIQSPVVKGSVSFFKKHHPLVRNALIGDIKIDGKEVSVVLERKHLNFKLRENAKIEVKVLYVSSADYSQVIAYKVADAN